MALRLEKAFSADRKKVPAIQAEYDEAHRHTKVKDVAVPAFVPA